MSNYSVCLQTKTDRNAASWGRSTFKVTAADKNAARCAAVEKAKAAGLVVGECFTVCEG